MANLPDGVTINPDSHSQSLDECHAICVTVVDNEGQESQVICWRGIMPILKPIEPGKRYRDLRPGDVVTVRDVRKTVTAVEIYR